MAKEGTGLKKETAAALATLLGPTLVVPIIFILLEKDEFVRFWAMQSIVTVIAFWVAYFALGIFALTIILAPIVLIVNSLLFIAGFVLLLVATYKAWQGEMWEIPMLGKIAKNLLKKI